MNSRNLDLAAQFCELVNKPHLLDYLGLPEDTSPDAAQKKLRARRKYMQGMQSNPKYKQEAMFLIKNFAALTDVLGQPVSYLDDARRRSESQHIPVLKMTIQGVLAGGALNHDQEDFLRRNAVELGVSEPTFESLLDQLCKESGVARANAAVRVNERELQTLDFYNILGAPRHASHDELYSRYRTRKEECQAITDPGQREAERMRVEKAWKILGSEQERRKYDLSWTRTGPPARNRAANTEAEASTAPPIKKRPSIQTVDRPAPSLTLRPASLEILSARQQVIELTNQPVVIMVEIRNGGEQALRGTVTSDQPWLKVLTPTLDPAAKQQSVRVEIDPAHVSGRSDVGQLRIVLESGHSSAVEFTVRRSVSVVPIIGGIAALAGLLFVGLVLGSFLFGDNTVTIAVDPFAAEVLVENKVVGMGRRVVLDDPPGLATLTVRHPNFKPWVKDIELDAGKLVSVDLELVSPMDFEPLPTMKRAKLDQEVAGQTMAEFQPQLDNCIRAAQKGGEMKGKLRIHIGKNGVTKGIDIDGDGDDSPAVLQCLRRQAAGPIFPPLTDGDFATVAYNYIITNR